MAEIEHSECREEEPDPKNKMKHDSCATTNNELTQ